MKKEKIIIISYISICIFICITGIMVAYSKTNNTENTIKNEEREIELNNTKELNNNEEVADVAVEKIEEEIVDEKQTEESVNTTVANTTFTIINSDNKTTVNNKTSNTNKKNSNTVKTNNKTNKNSTKTQKTINVTEKIKNALKDEEWVKENVMMKKSVFGDPIEHKQDLYFMILKGREAVLVEAVSEEDYSTQLFLVTYSNNKVIANSIEEYPIHFYHGGYLVDANNFVVNNVYMHMATKEDIFYKINANNFEKTNYCYKSENEYDESIGYVTYEYGIDDVIVSEEKYNEFMGEKEKYNFNSIETKLNDENLEKYM